MPRIAPISIVVVVLESATDRKEHRADDAVSEHHEEPPLTRGCMVAMPMRITPMCETDE